MHQCCHLASIIQGLRTAEDSRDLTCWNCDILVSTSPPYYRVCNILAKAKQFPSYRSMSPHMYERAASCNCEVYKMPSCSDRYVVNSLAQKWCRQGLFSSQLWWQWFRLLTSRSSLMAPPATLSRIHYVRRCVAYGYSSHRLRLQFLSDGFMFEV